MSTFRFRLQKVLDLRKLREQESAARVVEARREAEDAQRKLETLQARRTSVEELGRSSGSGRPAGQLQHLAFILEQIGEHLAAADEESKSADEKVDALVTEFAQAVRQRRVLDQLRDRKHGAWQVGQVQADRKLMDEIALSRHNAAPAPKKES